MYLKMGKTVLCVLQKLFCLSFIFCIILILCDSLPVINRAKRLLLCLLTEFMLCNTLSATSDACGYSSPR